MPKKGHTEEQIVAVLKQAEVGVLEELIRQVGSPSRLCIAGRSITGGWRQTGSGSSSSCRKRTRG